jgi:hypothetical protein
MKHGWLQEKPANLDIPQDGGCTHPRRELVYDEPTAASRGNQK